MCKHRIIDKRIDNYSSKKISTQNIFITPTISGISVRINKLTVTTGLLQELLKD